MDNEPSANENDNGGTSEGIGGYSTGLAGFGGPAAESSSDGATGAPPGLNSTGAKANDADGWGIPEAAANSTGAKANDADGWGIPEAAANSTGAKANDADGWAGLTKQVEVSAGELVNTVINTILNIVALLSGNPVAGIRAAQSTYNMVQSGAYSKFGSSPGVASTGKGAASAASAFSTGWTGPSDRGDSGMAPSPVIGWAGVTVNQPVAAPKVTALPSVGAYKLQSPVRLVNAPAAATGSPNQSGSTVAPAVVVAVGLGILLLA